MALGLKETQSGMISKSVRPWRTLILTVTVRYCRVLDGNSVRLKNVPAVGILFKAECVANCSNSDVGEDDIARVRDNIGPEGRVVQVEVGDRATFQPNCGEEDRSLYSLIGVEQIPPRLTIAFEGASSVDIDVLSTKQEETSSILEVELESIRLPEFGVVGEGNAALDVYVYVRQVAQIQRSADSVLGLLEEDHIYRLLAFFGTRRVEHTHDLRRYILRMQRERIRSHH